MRNVALLLLLLLFSVSLVSAARLSLQPVHYDVELTPVLDFGTSNDFQLITRTVIVVTVTSVTDGFTLFSNADIDNQTVTVTQQNSGRFEIKSFERINDNATYRCELSDSLPVNATVSITIGRAVSDMRIKKQRDKYLSFLHTKYKVGNKTEHFACSVSNNRLMFPYLDTLAFVTINVTVNRRSDFTAISDTASLSVQKVNSKQLFNKTVEGEWVKETFEETPRISVKMLSVNLLNLPSSCFNVSSSRLCVYGRPDKLDAFGQNVRRASDMIPWMERQFGTRCQLKVWNFFAVPEIKLTLKAEGTSVVVWESVFLINGSEALLKQAMIAHWFGYQTMPESPADQWIINGILQFLRLRAEAQLRRGRGEKEFGLIEFWSFRSSSEGKAAALASDSPEYFTSFLPFRQLIMLLGDQQLFTAIRQIFISSVNHRIVNTNDFMRSLTANGASQIHLDSLNSFISLAGLPVVNCSVKDGEIVLTQSRFLVNSSQTPDYVNPANSSWILPITMATKDNVTNLRGTEDVKNFVQWMTRDVQTFESFSSASSPSWYLVNVMSSGNYRVNYNIENWRSITKQLIDNHTVFTFQDRMRLIDDSFHLAAAGLLDFSIPTEMTAYLEKEKDEDVLLMTLILLADLSDKIPDPNSRLLAEVACPFEEKFGRTIQDIGMSHSYIALVMGTGFMRNFSKFCHPVKTIPTSPVPNEHSSE